MTPKHYLNVGTVLVLTMLGAIVNMNWITGGRVAEQHEAYETGQFQVQQLDHLRSALLQIVSSTTEITLITLATHGRKSGGTNDPVSSFGVFDRPQAAIATEHALITTAIGEYRLAAAQIDRTPLQAPIVPIRFDRELDILLKVNEELLGASLSDPPSKRDIFEFKEQQEEVQRDLLERVAVARGQVSKGIDAGSAVLNSSVVNLRRYAIQAGALATFILLCSNIYIRRRVSALFEEISSNQRAMEKANGDLSAALESLHGLQDQLVKKEKLATLGRLTATVSHELRNPLAAIRNYAFILRAQAGKAASVARYVEKIDRSVTRCDHIIADLLEYTKTRSLDLQCVDLASWLESCVKDHINIAGIKLSLVPAGSAQALQARIDPERFSRAIINLVENAAQAIDGAKIKGGAISISCSHEGQSVVIAISDNGPGIRPEFQKTIFEPLFTTKNFGAGLGLAITSSLVSEHGGTIELSSVPGEGATFTIRLPAVESQQLEVAA